MADIELARTQLDAIEQLLRAADQSTVTYEWYVHNIGTSNVNLDIVVDGAEAVRKVRAALGGKWEKFSQINHPMLRQYKLGIRVELWAWDVTCEAKVVGKKVELIPDPTFCVPMIEKEVDVIEWECPSFAEAER